MTPSNQADHKPTFETVVESYWNEILSYLWRMVSGAPEAEDYFQETFLRAFQAYPRLDANANVRAWLYRIATNVARTGFRRNESREKREGKASHLISQNVDPTHDLVQDRMNVDRAVQMVMKLPYKQRAAFMLRKYHDWTYAEIGEILECSQESARANMYQALRKLKEMAQRLEVGEL
jgi:RNA polymerase sigma-70 factor (ECF subfamily)